MSDSIYRPSGRRKGTHLRGAELTERIKARERAYAKHLDFAFGHFHCEGRDGRCPASLSSVSYGTKQMEDKDAVWYGRTATLECGAGHQTTISLHGLNQKKETSDDDNAD